MRKHALLVYPRFSHDHILSYEHLTPFYPGKLAVVPPLGLLAFAGLLRDRGGFELRLVDENIAALSPVDLAWADIVCVSGMHSQKKRITELLAAGNAAGKVTVLGGPSASCRPGEFPGADVLHVGELGDGSESLVAMLRTGGKPAMQRIFRTELKLEAQPLPAIELVDVHRYIAMPLEPSVGRVPRIKSAARIVQELDQILATGFVGAILFVGDALVSSRKELSAVLPELTAWQKRHRYPYPLCAEASIGLAHDQHLIGALRDARFTPLFLALETPHTKALRMPLLQAIERIEKAEVGGIKSSYRRHFWSFVGAVLTLRADGRLTSAHHATTWAQKLLLQPGTACAPEPVRALPFLAPPPRPSPESRA